MATTATTVQSSSTTTQPNSLKPLLGTIRVILVYGVLIFFALLTIMPFVYTVVNSFKTTAEINTSPMSLVPTEITTRGYDRVLNSRQIDFARATFNSFFIAALTTIAHLLFNSMAGYALARVKFPGRSIAFAALVGTLMVPAIVLLIPRYLVLRQLGLVDTYGGILLPTLATAFGIFLMKQFFEQDDSGCSSRSFCRWQRRDSRRWLSSAFRARGTTSRVR
jgi:multiple sugar transport system permease protein